MKEDEKKSEKSQGSYKENVSEKKEARKTDEAAKKGFPGYPKYPASEDIYSREKETDLNPEDPTKIKTSETYGDRNEKEFLEDLTAEDLDVPGSKADETVNNAGMEDEENNYYSLGGDNHNDLEEDKG